MYLPSGIRLGPYKIKAPIGAGGMGEVYRATDTRLNRDVAVKILSSRLTAEPNAKQRFEREAHAASALNDPHICTIYDVGEHEGRQFLVMELLEGRTLKQYIYGQASSVKQVLKLGTQIAGALQTAHGRGIIHSDLKPANIFVTEGGEIKVLDFGLTKLLQQTDQDATLSQALTEPLTVLGTLPYAAPEQLRCENTDARTDIWGFGTVLYEMATSQRPFSEEVAPRLIDAILHKSRTVTRAERYDPCGARTNHPQVPGQPRDEVAGVVDGDVDATGLGDDGIDSSLDRGVVGHIQFKDVNGQGTPFPQAYGFQRHSWHYGLRVTHRGENGVPFTRQGFGEQSAEASAGASDENHLL